MNFLTHLLSPVAMRLLALTLLHFLWQGAALAALAYAAMSLCRTSASRYVVGVALLTAMAAAPAVTLLSLQGDEPQLAAIEKVTQVTTQPSVISLAPAHSASASNVSVNQGASGYFLWLVELWFVGVMMFSLRSAGGVFLVERLRRRESRQVSETLRELGLSLQTRMGLQRVVSFYECARLDAPAVAGWLRPVVMLPVTALTGLNEVQLSSVIAHELAHIKRFDSLVNLFQIGVETLLFYHPAVWWLNKRIREERENCCDDMAVEVCGNPLTYAHALARLAESQTAPRLMMAANGRPLAARVARLLGVGNKSERISGAELSLGLLCLSASLLAGVALIGVARNVHAETPVSPEPLVITTPVDAPTISVTAPYALPVVAVYVPSSASLVQSVVTQVPVIHAAVAIAVRTAIAAAFPTPQAAPATTAISPSSYLEGLKAAGLDNLTVDQIVELKIQGVTPEYVKSMHDLGMRLDPDDLVGMKIQNITPEYVKQMRAATRQHLDLDDLIGMKIQGITPEYVKQIEEQGLKADAGELVGMKIQGITPEYVREMRKLDPNVDTGDLTGMKIQGITPEYVKNINALDLHPDAGELIGMRVQGIDADYLGKMQAAGIKLNVEDAIGAKIMGVTPEFVEKARSHGFKDLSLHQLIGLKQSGALDETKH